MTATSDRVRVKRPSVGRRARPRQSVFVHVVDRVLDASLRGAVALLPHRPVNAASKAAILVSDDLSRDLLLPRLYAIEVVRPRPRFAARAVESLLAQRSQGIVLADDPPSIDAVLAACSLGVVGATPRVLELMNQYPPFEPRQETVLGFIAQGTSTESIGDELGVSMSTVKRDIAAIQELAGVSSRRALVGQAIMYGFSPPGIDHLP